MQDEAQALVERLRAFEGSDALGNGDFTLCDEAADLISRQQAEIARLREALTRLRDCDWVITLPDRMDAVRDIARQALG